MSDALFSSLLCKAGLHRWKMYGPFREDDEWRAMWARCSDCDASRYLMPEGGKYPRLVFGRGIRDR